MVSTVKRAHGGDARDLLVAQRQRLSESGANKKEWTPAIDPRTAVLSDNTGRPGGVSGYPRVWYRSVS